MSSEKKPKGKSEYDVNNVRVRKSYYTFSKEYPHLLGKQSRRVRYKRKRLRSLRIAAAVLCFVFIALLAYFAAQVGLKFSYKEDTLPEVSSTQAEGEAIRKNLLEEKGIRAICYPTEKLGDMKFMKSFVLQAKRKEANSVVIEFKTADGHLAYSSKNETAIISKCSIFDNETVRNAIAYFKSKNMAVVAGIYCFEDPLVSGVNDSMAVKYMNSGVVWLDGFEEENGRTWLNPYSAEAVSYILDIMNEVSSFGVSGFILKSVCFPYSGDTESAGYPGENSKSERNACLLSFIEKAKQLLPGDKFLLVSQSSVDALSGNELKYNGTISRCSADGICADMAQKPDGYVIDRKTKYSSLLSLLSSIRGSVNEDSVIVPMFDKDDFSWTLNDTLEQNGYASYIIY